MSITSTGPQRRAAGTAGRFSLANHGALVALLIIILVNVAITPNFLSWQTVHVNLTQVAPIAIVAIGMTFVIATGGIDLSVGSLMAIAGALAPMIFLGKLGLAPGPVALTLAFVVPILLVMFFGALNGLLVARLRVQPIIATLVLFIAGRGIAQVMTNGNLQAFTNDTFQFVALGRVAGVPMQVLLMLAIALMADFIIRRTRIGRQILAVGGNEHAARLAGVPVARVKRFVYVVSAATAGVAGLIVVGRNSASDANLVGLGMELDAIAAVAVGGTLLSGGKANIVGTLIGALIIQLVRFTLLANGIPDAAAMVVKATLIVAAVYLQRRAAP
jgi:ribose transport system permease protein